MQKCRPQGDLRGSICVTQDLSGRMTGAHESLCKKIQNFTFNGCNLVKLVHIEGEQLQRPYVSIIMYAGKAEIWPVME